LVSKLLIINKLYEVLDFFPVRDETCI